MSTKVSGSGSSLWVVALGQVEILTNFHIVVEGSIKEAGEYVPPTCYAVYPKPPNFSYDGSRGNYQLKLLSIRYNPDSYQDTALFKLGDPVDRTTPLKIVPSFDLSSSVPVCLVTDIVNVGDRLTIFGYPNSGNLLGISETVTDGIISGILPGPIYKTSAPIDHGNSGGIAVLNKAHCILGIPTLGESGLTAGIGYVQSLWLALTDSSTTQKWHAP